MSQILKHLFLKEGEPTETIMFDETTPSIDKIVVEKAQNEKEKEEYLQLCFIKLWELQLLIFLCLGINIIDIILIPIFPNNFFNFWNILSILLITASTSICLFIFKKKLQTINKSVYRDVKKILYIISIIIVFVYIDMLYVIIFKLLLNEDVSWDGDFIFLPIIMAMSYAGINFVFPVLIIAKIIEILNIIKEIGFIEGDNYSISSIATVPSLKLDRSQFTIENLSDRKRKIPHTPYSINKIMIITLLF